MFKEYVLAPTSSESKVTSMFVFSDCMALKSKFPDGFFFIFKYGVSQKPVNTFDWNIWNEIGSDNIFTQFTLCHWMLTHKIRDKNLPLTRKKLSLIWAHGNFFGYDIERIKLYWIYFKISICKEGGIVKLKFKLNFLTIN